MIISRVRVVQIIAYRLDNAQCAGTYLREFMKVVTQLLQRLFVTKIQRQLLLIAQGPAKLVQHAEKMVIKKLTVEFLLNHVFCNLFTKFAKI